MPFIPFFLEALARKPPLFTTPDTKPFHGRSASSWCEWRCTVLTQCVVRLCSNGVLDEGRIRGTPGGWKALIPPFPFSQQDEGHASHTERPRLRPLPGEAA